MSTAEMEAIRIVIRWILVHGTSNVEIAVLSNVCRGWSELVHDELIAQAFAETLHSSHSLLLVPSMLRFIIRHSERPGEAKLSRDGSERNETFCAAWFRPDGIQEKYVRLNVSKDEELLHIHKMVVGKFQKLLHTVSGKKGFNLLDEAFTSDEDELVRNVLNVAIAPKETCVPIMEEWRGIRLPMEVLESFLYRADFVHNLLQATWSRIASREGKTEPGNASSMRSILCVDAIEEADSRVPTCAVRGATVVRPEGYCLCMDDIILGETATKEVSVAEILRLLHTQTSDGDDEDDEVDHEDDEFRLIRLREYKDYLVRKEVNRRELQREVLPRVIWSCPPTKERKNRCVQFLNASGNHAVCAMTPTFSCGPIEEPITLIMVGIATEEGCFMSGLNHRFEVGHIYPENDIVEQTGQSSICVAIEASVTDSNDFILDTRVTPQLSASNGRNGAMNGPADAVRSRNADDVCSYHSRGSDRDDDKSWHHDKCTCVFRNNVSKTDALDSDCARRIYRGRFGPGRWHCYTVIADGEHSQIRVDGISEPIHRTGSSNIMKGILDGITIGSDHCFAVSLCCGQAPTPEGDGAIAEVAVFQGRLMQDDLEVLETNVMTRHGIPRGDSCPRPAWQDNDMEKRAEALFLWPPPQITAREENASMPSCGVPLRFLSQNRCVAWKQYHPVTGKEVKIPRIGARASASSSDW